MTDQTEVLCFHVEKEILGHKFYYRGRKSDTYKFDIDDIEYSITALNTWTNIKTGLDIEITEWMDDQDARCTNTGLVVVIRVPTSGGSLTYKACDTILKKCVEVSGAGTDTCTSDSSCDTTSTGSTSINIWQYISYILVIVGIVIVYWFFTRK